MTEEQIKQNAEEYASKLVERDYHEDMWLDLYDAHIAGAHSRDEEIEQLKKLLFEKDCDIQFLEHKLRNPWISVEDRLPKEGKCVFVRYGDVTHSLYSSAYMIEKDLWSIEGYGNGEVTHWMPIPQIEKGE